MNKMYTAALLAALSTAGFASETSALIANPTLEATPASLTSLSVNSTRNWFGYMRMGLADSQPTGATEVLPNFGIGYRHALGNGAIDVSASYNSQQAFAEEQSAYFLTLPRISGLYYLDPVKEQSFYAGAGVSYAAMKTKQAEHFYGIAPSISVGYEMNRNQTFHTFLQLDISQPALSMASGTFFNLPTTGFGPFAEFSLGLGF